jgi:hypothetical protein
LTRSPQITTKAGSSSFAWPIDAPTLRRFALYLAIPFGSWFGGALVERMVDALLD